MAPSVVAGQVRAGAWGEVRLVVRKKPGKYASVFWLPGEKAREIVEFHKKHVVFEKLAKKLGRHKRTLARAFSYFSGLPELHPAVLKAGGKLAAVNKGGYRYLPLAQLPIAREMTNFISLDRAARKCGVSVKALKKLVEGGHLPGAAMFRTRKRFSLVHRDVVGKLREFKRLHYPVHEAQRLAGLTQSGFHKWIVKWGFPHRRMPAQIRGTEIHVPKKGFKELVEAFKKGKKAASEARLAWRIRHDWQTSPVDAQKTSANTKLMNRFNITPAEREMLKDIKRRIKGRT